MRQAFLAEARPPRRPSRRSRPACSCCAARRGSSPASRAAKRRPARGCRPAPWNCRTGSRPSSISSADRPSISSLAVFGNSSTRVVMPATSLRSTTRPIVQAVCSISRQLSESSRGGVGVVTLRSSAMSAGRCANRQVSRACTGQVLKSIVKSMCAWRVGERPVERGVEQAEQQRAVDDDARRLELRLQGDAAGLGLAGAQGEHALHHLLELQHLVRLAHAAGGEAGELLADHADLARLLDLVAQGAQAGAVDLAGGGEDVDPLERRGQRRGDLGADLGHELMPSLVVHKRHGVNRRGFRTETERRAEGIESGSAKFLWARTPARPGRLESDPERAAALAGRPVSIRVAFRREVSAPAPQAPDPDWMARTSGRRKSAKVTTCSLFPS